MLDLGPEGGKKGGELVAEGTPEDVAREPRSYTGSYLRPLLAASAPAAAVEPLRKAPAKRARKPQREAAE